MPQVLIGRVQRRPGNEPLASRPFKQDLDRLASTDHLSVHAGDRTWIASDLKYDATGVYLTGVLGFASTEFLFKPDHSSFSWLKADVLEEFGGTPQTVVPFALDSRDDRRWVGFTTTSRVKAQTFTSAFATLLQSAVTTLGLLPVEWEVDLIPRLETLREWISAHPDIAEVVRTVKFSNPPTRLDNDRQAMRQLGANQKVEHWKPPKSKRLDSNSEVFRDFESEAADGVVELVIYSRSGASRVRFATTDRKAVESYNVPAFGTDLERGISLVREQVERFSAGRAGEGQARLL